MKKREVINVRASEILGTSAAKAIVVKVLHDIGHEYYRYGLFLVQCLDDPLGMYCEVDAEGYLYSGPPTVDGMLARFP